MLLKHNVLIAEDDDSIVEMVDIALAGAGHKCLRADNGAKAIEMLRLYAPDLLVLDVMMPRMDGIEAAQHIRKDELLAETPILMLTALSSLDNKVEGLDAGADSYLPKPFDVREFTAQINALLRAKKHGRERHPVTNLPGPGAITEVLEEAPGTEDATTIVHLAVREFDRYAEEADFDKAAALQRSLGDFLQDKMRAHFLFTSFLGHRGGGQFVMVLPSDKAEALVRDVLEGFDATHSGWLGDDTPVEKMTMAAALASTEELKAGDIEALARRVATAMKAANEQAGSHLAAWQPDKD